MPKKKIYKAVAAVAGDMPDDSLSITDLNRIDESSRSAYVALPVNPTTHRGIDLSSWIGHGIDGWVWATVQSLEAMLRSGAFAPATVLTSAAGVKAFFEFLTGVLGASEPTDLDHAFVMRFISWLKLRYGDSTSTAKGKYTRLKSVLLIAIDRGIIWRGKPESDRWALFPTNPFPGTNAKHRGSEPLSRTEIQQLANALKSDLIAIHHGRFEGTEAQAITVSFLVVAMRTGANMVPLLELTRDCLSDNPFAPNMMVMRIFKRRGNATQLKAWG